MPASNPARSWHHISVRDPKTWKIVGTVQLGRRAESTNRSDFGIQARLGKKGGRGKTRWVTLLFDPRLWTLERAKKWVTDHREKVREAVEATEQPGHELSGRARAIKHSRASADAVKAYRSDLLEAGVAFVVPSTFNAAKFAKTFSFVDVDKKGDHDVTDAVRYALKNGAFTDGKRCLLIVPPALANKVEALLIASDPEWVDRVKGRKGVKITSY